jgi:hypothetical protein
MYKPCYFGGGGRSGGTVYLRRDSTTEKLGLFKSNISKSVAHTPYRKGFCVLLIWGKRRAD